MIFSNEFRLLAQEGHLANNALLSGFENIAKYDPSQPGTIYSFLFNISIGLERILKLTIIVDFLIKNDFRLPTNSHLRSFGHDIVNQFNFVGNISRERNFLCDFFEQDCEISDFLSLFSEFSRITRYYNLDGVANEANDARDPLIVWCKLHLSTAEKYLTHKKINSINQKSISYCDNHNLYNFVMGFFGKYELIVDYLTQLEIMLASRGYCVWTIIRIIKPIHCTLEKLCRIAHEMEIEKKLEKPIVPHLEEFFPYAYTSKSDAIRRKRWTRIFEAHGRF
jgi:hypothetical protein